jgi:hypothetical protein
MAYDADQQSLKDLRLIIQSHEPCVYLEVGSELGRSLLPALIDPGCSAVLSVDSRPGSTPDERGRTWEYGVTTQMMRDELAKNAVPEEMAKLSTFDMGTDMFSALVNMGSIKIPQPNLVFIDAEHTNAAVFRDFLHIQHIVPENCIVAFHDSNLIFDALTNITEMLKHEMLQPFAARYLKDVVFAYGFGKYKDPVEKLWHWEEKPYLAHARQTLNDEIIMNAPLRQRI